MGLLINGIDTAGTTFAPSLVRGHLIRFEPYPRPSPTDREFQNGERLTGQRIRRLREAITHINTRIRPYEPANRAFELIPGGSGFSLDRLLATFDILICLDRGHVSPLSGATPVAAAIADRTRISLTRGAFGRTGRFVEATIIHELAHVNGASNSSASRDAENVLLHCRLGDQFNPLAFG